MKNLIILFILSIAASVFMPSCEKMMGDYLDKAPGVDVTEDTIFSSQSQLETAIAGMYRYGMNSTFPVVTDPDGNWTNDYMPSSAATDEAESANTWTNLQTVNNGDVTPDNIIGSIDYRFNVRFEAIRKANIILERADDVPDVDQSYISQVKGEARFIRALNYFEMMKRYGGMPIIWKKFELTDNFNIPRSPIKDVVDFIVGQCDTCAMLLPDSYSSGMRGRVTKGAALALKARTLLFAASPLFNTGSPYMDMADPADNNLICMGSVDASLWQKAADAAKEVIDWSPSGGIALITNQGVDKNYRYIFEHSDNSEIILANKSWGSLGIWDYPWTFIYPMSWYSYTWWMGYSMTVNFMKYYEKQDGTPQTWDPVGGTDLIPKYNELDRRFLQSVCPVGGYWNSDIPLNNSQVGGAAYSGCVNAWITKHLLPTVTGSSSYGIPNDILFRLGEFYLDYAEALNEAQGPVQDAYDAVNTIRERSGQPDLPAGLTQEQFRARVRNERGVELFDEDQHLWDIKRWMIAEQDGVMQGNMYGFKTYPNPDPPNYRYETYVFETRSWNRREYLWPITRSEVLKGYLKQNPGY